MVYIVQNLVIHHLDGTTDAHPIRHIYSPEGHFLDRYRRPAGWHIQLAWNDKPENYSEYYDPNDPHEVPESLPNVDIYEEPEPEEEDDGYME